MQWINKFQTWRVYWRTVLAVRVVIQFLFFSSGWLGIYTLVSAYFTSLTKEKHYSGEKTWEEEALTESTFDFFFDFPISIKEQISRKNICLL